MLIAKIDNIDELYRKIGEMTLRGTFKKAMKKSGMLVERNAKKETPVDLGDLRGAYETKLGDYETVIKNKMVYAPYVTVKGSPGELNDYIGRTEEKSQDKINEIFITEINQLLEKLGN